MSWGVGKPSLAPSATVEVANSSRTMSLHKSMHSSQMKTEGPAINFLTSCWLFPQKEQYRFFSVVEPFLSAIDLPRNPNSVNDNERKTALASQGQRRF